MLATVNMLAYESLCIVDFYKDIASCLTQDGKLCFRKIMLWLLLDVELKLHQFHLELFEHI